MKTYSTLLVSAALLLIPAVKGQQTTQPQPQPTAPQSPATASGCAATPVKKPTFLDKLKKHVEQTVKNQAAKADAKIAKASKGSVDGGVQDSTATAIAEVGQPQPCPAKAQPAKQ